MTEDEELDALLRESDEGVAELKAAIEAARNERMNAERLMAGAEADVAEAERVAGDALTEAAQEYDRGSGVE